MKYILYIIYIFLLGFDSEAPKSKQSGKNIHLALVEEASLEFQVRHCHVLVLQQVTLNP